MSRKENILNRITRKLSTSRDYGLEECAELVWNHSKEISAFYIKEGYRNQGDIRAFARVLATDIMAEAVRMTSLENIREGSDYGYPIEFASFLAESVDHMNKMFIDGKIKMDEKRYHANVKKYREAIYNILKPRIEDFNETVTESSIAATELLSVVPVPHIVYEDRILGPYVGKVIQKLLLLATTFVNLDTGSRPLYEPFDKATVQDIFEFLFGSEKLYAVSRAVLSSYNNGILPDEKGKCKLITFAAEVFESMDNKHLKKELKEIVDFKLRGNREKDLRIDKVNLEEYPRIQKRLMKILEKRKGK